MRVMAQRAQAQGVQGGGGGGGGYGGCGCGETVPSAADLRLEKLLEKEALAAHVAEGRSATGCESAAHGVRVRE